MINASCLKVSAFREMRRLCYLVLFSVLSMDSFAWSSGKGLLEYCLSEDRLAYGACVGYIEAVRQIDIELDYWKDTKKAIRGVRAEDVFPRSCMTRNRENWKEAVEVVVSWLQKNDAIIDKHRPFTLILRALSERYPCEKGSIRNLNYKWDEEIEMP